jgi:hypothetical protein
MLRSLEGGRVHSVHPVQQDLTSLLYYITLHYIISYHIISYHIILHVDVLYYTGHATGIERGCVHPVRGRGQASSRVRGDHYLYIHIVLRPPRKGREGRPT